MKLWGGRFSKSTDKSVDDFNSSIRFDQRMYRQDITGSIAHAKMLGRQGIIDKGESDLIVKTLGEILDDIENGKVEFLIDAEDIHMNVETILISRIGDTGKRLHTGRSRNDQVALDVRMYLRDEAEELGEMLDSLLETILSVAEENVETIMPGYTHLQKAQPITLAHHFMAYYEMFKRDRERLLDWRKRVNIMPLGSGALAGTTYPLDREFVAKELGFDSVTKNSLDGVSDRDFVCEMAFVLSMIMMHLSRFSEEIILWSSNEFGFVDLDDAYSTGSSIMPQKKNPDVAELARGKTSIATGELITILTILKAIPYTYNRDLQEITPHLWNAVNVTGETLSIVTKMMLSVEFNVDRCAELAGKNFATATDLADIMVREKQIPFRTAHKIVGRIVNEATASNMAEEDITSQFIDEIAVDLGFDKLSLDDELIQNALNPRENVKIRRVVGGPAPEMVEMARDNIKVFLNEEFEKKGI